MLWRPRCSAIAPAARPAPSTPSPGGSSDRTTVTRWSKDCPGRFEQAVADADAFFARELPALQHAEPLELPTTHLLHLQNPRQTAEALASYARHPITASTA